MRYNKEAEVAKVKQAGELRSAGGPGSNHGGPRRPGGGLGFYSKWNAMNTMVCSEEKRH